MYISYIAYTPFAFQITQYNYYLQEWFSSSILLNVSIYRIAKKKSKLIRKKINSLLRGIRINMPISIIHHHHITITHKYIHTHTRFCCPLYTHTLFPLYSLWPSKEDWFITDYHLLNKKFDNNQTCLPAWQQRNQQGLTVYITQTFSDSMTGFCTLPLEILLSFCPNSAIWYQRRGKCVFFEWCALVGR